ncbi:MAG: putative RNA polymerase [Prokaryotic dsDNA virus sp.]|nr:MAG: putative RNA polymerase [Prokaryotic dsDNA virus sp.]
MVKHEQAELEAEMAKLGKDRYRHRKQKAEAKQLETTTPAGQWLLQNAVGHLAERIESWVATANSKPGRRHRAVPYFELLPKDLTAALIARSVLDSVSHKKAFTRSAMQVASILEDECRYMALAQSDPGLWTQVKRKVREYMGYSVKRRTVIAMMNKMEHSFIRWTQQDKLQVGTVAIQLLAEATGLIEIRTRTTIFGKSRTEVVAADKTMRWLEESHARSELLSPIYMPCLERPKDWTDPFNGGFHTADLHKRTLVKSWDRAYLEDIKDDPMPELYEAVNTIQSTMFKVNGWLLDVMKYYWENDLEVSGLPLRHNIEVPARPVDIAENTESRKSWRREAAAVHDHNARSKAERLMLAKVVHVAEKYCGKSMAFVAQLDWRSRCYATSYHLHPQGPDYVKALLLFDKGKPLLTEDAVRWFKISGANCWGLTKSTYEERVAWVDANEQMILEIARDPKGNRSFEGADEPWQFLAWCNEYRQFKELGDDYISRIPVALDATQSGVQVLSLLLRDPVGAKATNCTPSERPQDLYQLVADKVIELLKAKGDDPIAQMWLNFGIDRKSTKRICMTKIYSAQLFSAMGYVREWAVDKAGDKSALPTENDYRACLYLARTIWAAMDECISGAQRCMDWLGQVADICVKARVPVRWNTPIGFHVKQDYRKFRSRSVKTRIGDTIRQHKLREETDAMDRRKMINGLVPNFVHSLDAALLYKTVNCASTMGVRNFAVVHDSFATLAADTEKLATAIRTSAAEMFSEDILMDFKLGVESMLPGIEPLPDLPEYGTLDPSVVKESLFFFN